MSDKLIPPYPFSGVFVVPPDFPPETLRSMLALGYTRETIDDTDARTDQRDDRKRKPRS